MRLIVVSGSFVRRACLVAGPAGLGDDALELVDLRLGTAESTELDHSMLAYCCLSRRFLH